MKNTFMDNAGTENRTTTYFYEQVDKLRADLKELINGDVSEMEVRTYVEKLTGQVTFYNEAIQASFWALDNPARMPSDARVDFVFVPTYLAVSIISYSFLHYEGIRNIPDLKKTLWSAMNGCLARSTSGIHFTGSGYDGVKGFLEAMDIFADGELNAFIETYPQLNPDFTKAWTDAMDYLTDSICTGEVTDPWSGRSYAEQGKAVLEKMGKESPNRTELLFVYGTLMSGERASCMLDGHVCRGMYLLSDHGMYDLGSFPGVVPLKGESVVGEIYEICDSDFERFDAYEGNGSLYTRRQLEVEANGVRVQAWVYIYNGNPGEKLLRHPWNYKNEDVVWYAVYGSNLQKDRFLCYVQGGTCKENHKPYPGCTDKTLPSAEDSMWVKGRLYFGRHSKSWDDMGVAFYDPDAEGKTYMRLYQSTYGQLRDIQKQEGCGPRWYGRSVILGIQKDGIPVFTITSEIANKQNPPSDNYLNLICDALTDENGFTKKQAEEYLEDALSVIRRS